MIKIKLAEDHAFDEDCIEILKEILTKNYDSFEDVLIDLCNVKLPIVLNSYEQIVSIDTLTHDQIFTIIYIQHPYAY